MSTDPRLNSALAGYRIESVLGRGGMGVVYGAIDEALGRRVALKILAPPLANDEAFRRRFVRESRMAAAIDHPNIVPIYEAGKAGGALYIAMRYVDGTDLGALIERDGPLSPERALDILEQVARALDAAHARGLIHRDVKPANILLTAGQRPDAPEHVYLTDFGLSRAMSSPSDITQAGQVVGSPHYMAPEQIRGEPVDGRTDIYSLGCVLYSCLTGRPPFEKDTVIAAAYAHLSETPPPLSGLRRDLPVDLDAIVGTAIAKAKEDRYPTCGAFLAAARGAGLPGSALASPIAVAATRDGDGWSRGRRWGAWLAGATLVTALALFILLGLPALRDRQEGPAAPGPEDAAIGGEAARVANTLVMSSSGGRVRFLTEGEVADGAASWSPDGTEIAFASSRDGAQDIFVMNADGSSIRRLTEDPEPDRHPAWSPDGARVAYETTVQGRAQIFVIPAEGGEATQLTDDRFDNRMPAWSPDGDRIAFVRIQGAEGDIYVMEADGGEAVALTDTPANERAPAWSPDGTRIAFHSTTEAEQIFVMAADGTDVQQLTDLPLTGSNPVWSPDGKMIAFVQVVAGRTHIAVMESDGSNVRNLTQNQNSDANPDWSPDGTKIVFTRTMMFQGAS
ncbi:MAG: serine/threonine-protein kinase [Actinobacteria bacterium]|nr:serine/threonine-protein kinase [Actinomycetota bacterium]